MADDPNRPEGDGSGCGTLFGWLILLGIVVAAAMSIAALVDPFSKLPTVADVWADCPPAEHGPDGTCDLEDRHPGFWGKVAGSLTYTLVTVLALGWLASTTRDLRDARRRLFSDPDGPAAYRTAREGFVGAALVVAVLGLIPVIVAVVP